jgi:DNA-binding protein HU-beta
LITKDEGQGTFPSVTSQKTASFSLEFRVQPQKQKRKARTGINPSTKQKIKIPAKTVIKFRVFKVAKDAILGVKE